MATAFDTTLSSLGIAAKPAATPTTGQTTLGQADFLKLMTAQLKSQDPFSPVDNTQMIGQMAQFSQLAGISEMSTTLKAISDKLGATSTSDAVSYVGRTVLTAGNTAFGRTSGGIAGGVELAGAATNVTVTVQSADGRLLKSVDLGAQNAGTLSYDWDGKLADGTDAGIGPFTVSVSAKNGADPVAAQPLVWSPVQSVSTTSGQTMLSLPGLGDVPATQVRQIG